MGRYPMYDREDFILRYVDAYKRGIHVSQLAKEIGISRQAIDRRASYCRQIGIELPSLLDGRRQKESERLNRLIIERLEGQH